MDASAPELHAVITCEHGGNRIPRAMRARFAGAAAALASHRGWDPGALPVAKRLAASLGAPLLVSTTSRLLIDLNRSAGHPREFSEFTRGLSAAEKSALRRAHYEPLRQATLRAVAAAAKRGVALHVSVHSFTPVMNGVRRECDIGLLYDPRRPGERMLARTWRRALVRRRPRLRVRMNSPYHGASDGHTTALRQRFSSEQYIGIELEINQRFWRAGAGSRGWRELVEAIEASLLEAAGGPVGKGSA